jgi:class 3 adenylate cyclase
LITKILIMKTILPFLLLLLSLSSPGQDAMLEELQLNFQESTGIESIELGNILFDIFYDKKEYKEAADLAKQIRGKAKALGYPNLEAVALNQEAKALIAIGEKRFKNRTRGIRRIRESQRLIREKGIDNKELVQLNKKLLRTAATKLGIDENFNTAKKIINQSWDSIRVEVAELEIQEHMPSFNIGKPSSKKEKKREEAELKRQRKREKMVVRILEANKKELELEMAETNNSHIFIPQEIDSIIQASMKEIDQVQVVWRIEKEQIEEDLAKEETKIKEMDTDEVKEKLLFAHYKSMYDSLAHLRMVDSLNLVKQDAELQQQESELARQKIQQSFSMMGAGGSSLLFLLILFSYFKQRKNNRLLSEKNLQIQAEQDRSEGLLLNILPAKVADELKQFGTAQAHKYESVSVLFTDFKNFSQIAEQLSAEQLVAELDYCFKAFDNIIDKHGLEKIKTIGDAYMCAGGLPMPNEDNAKLAVRAAIEIQDFLEKWNKQKVQDQKPCFEARIGIHTGPIVAGVVGTKKFAYDIWGDTVNIAARMESKGETRKINISGTTYELVKDDFKCTYRGMINVKNKGGIAMYFVKG